MQKEKDNLQISIEQNFKGLDLFPISFNFHLYLLFEIQSILILIKLIDLVTSKRSVSINDLVVLAGGMFGVFVFYILVTAFIALYLASNRGTINFYTNRIVYKSKSNRIIQLTYSRYQRYHKVRFYKRFIVVESILGNNYRDISKLITHSIIIPCTEGSRERSLILKLLKQ